MSADSVRAVLVRVADLLGELTVTAQGLTPRPWGTIGRSGHGDGIVTAAIDPTVCPLPGDAVHLASGWHHLRPDGVIDPRCLCDLAGVRTALTGWVRVLIEETPGVRTPWDVLRGPQTPRAGEVRVRVRVRHSEGASVAPGAVQGAVSTEDLARWLADHHAEAAGLEAAHELHTEMRAVAAALERTLRVRDASSVERLHAWLPVHQALATARIERPDLQVSDRTVRRWATMRAGTLLIQPATIIARHDTPDIHGTATA